jgi:hypothetical protein
MAGYEAKPTIGGNLDSLNSETGFFSRANSSTCLTLAKTNWTTYENTPRKRVTPIKGGPNAARLSKVFVGFPHILPIFGSYGRARTRPALTPDGFSDTAGNQSGRCLRSRRKTQHSARSFKMR